MQQTQAIKQVHPSAGFGMLSAEHRAGYQNMGLKLMNARWAVGRLIASVNVHCSSSHLLLEHPLAILEVLCVRVLLAIFRSWYHDDRLDAKKNQDVEKERHRRGRDVAMTHL